MCRKIHTVLYNYTATQEHFEICLYIESRQYSESSIYSRGSRLDPLLLSHNHLFILTRALELQPFSLKPLLRRAMAYESLERYRQAYVDYKTVLQIDNSVQAAHDSVNRY